jgi:hypothetical protein
MLGFFVARYSEPYRTSVASDLDGEVEEGAALAFEGGEFRELQ